MRLAGGRAGRPEAPRDGYIIIIEWEVVGVGGVDIKR